MYGLHDILFYACVLTLSTNLSQTGKLLRPLIFIINTYIQLKRGRQPFPGLGSHKGAANQNLHHALKKKNRWFKTLVFTIKEPLLYYVSTSLHC
jgi:hypothetical protein